MKKLWIPLILAFTLAIVLFVPSNRRHRHKVSESSLARPPDEPERIVSLAPNLTEILFALGLDEKIVAVSSDSDWPAEASDKTKVGTFWQPNTEAVIASMPDLVITLWFEQQRAVADTLRRLEFNVLTLKIERIEELLSAIRKIGAATGSSQRADELIEDIEEKIDNFRSKLDLADKAGVLWVVQAEPLRVAGRNVFISEIIELAGGENAVGPTIQRYPQISTEQLLVCSPDVIIQSAMGTAGIERQQQAAEVFWSRFENLPAVRNKRIYVVDSDTVLRLGPRLCQGIELIAALLQPNIVTQGQNGPQRPGK